MREPFQLPPGWSEPSLLEDMIVADGVELHRVGVSATGPSGEEVTGAAAEALAPPIARSCFELLERVSVLEALGGRRARYEARTALGEGAGQRAPRDVFPESDDPERWRYARSNGVALHVDWRHATTRALWELAERDRVLRAWYGEIRPRAVAWPRGAAVLQGARSYEWLAYEFPELEPVVFSRGIHVAGVFGFPLRQGLPLVAGYGARSALAHALDAAVREATQGLAFLWGEPLPTGDPELSPTPAYHLEHFQLPEHHDIVRRWLEGAHVEFGRAEDRDAASEVAFVDLTPRWMERGLTVAKAVCAAATPLVFGEAPRAAHLPRELRVHPIA